MLVSSVTNVESLWFHSDRVELGLSEVDYLVY